MRGKHPGVSILMFAIVSVLPWQMALSERLAFPGAEGFGAYSEGGRGGDVYYVTNVNDSGAGSLRYGIDSASGPRTIVFAVSGVIQLESDLEVDQDYITIAGQTAPGDGICLRDACFKIKADHVIVRYIRSRLGDDAGRESDAISITRGKNIIMDHCSASWSVDECFSCSTGDRDKIDNITVQWCIISEALKNSIHSKGAHSYGALIRGCYGAKYSYHHNLFAHNSSRNPRPGNYDRNTYVLDPNGLQFDFRNNVLYNWNGTRPGYDADTDSVCRYNYVANYGKPGPNSSTPGWIYKAGCKHFRAYYSGNYFDGSIPTDQWSLVYFSGSWTQSEKEAYKQTVPFSTGPIVTDTAQEAYDKVMEHAGASLGVRDSVDARVISDVRNGTGAIIDDEDEVGSWPVYNTYDVAQDTDRDGMSDVWETAKGLDPSDPDDRNDDPDDDGYTNLEEYLHWLTLAVPVVEIEAADMTDFAVLSEYWRSGCSDSDGWCEGMDYDHMDGVNIDDLQELAFRWLWGREDEVFEPVDYQAEDGAWSEGALVETEHDGYTGTGYVNTENNAGEWCEITVNVAGSGEYDMTLRYANGSSDRPVEVSVDGDVAISSLSMPGTGDWKTWDSVEFSPYLESNNNTIRFTALGSSGTANLDKLVVEGKAL